METSPTMSNFTLTVTKNCQHREGNVDVVGDVVEGLAHVSPAHI